MNRMEKLDRVLEIEQRRKSKKQVGIAQLASALGDVAKYYRAPSDGSEDAQAYRAAAREHAIMLSALARKMAHQIGDEIEALEGQQNELEGQQNGKT